MDEEARPLGVGSVIAGRLELVEILGEGSAGRVYRARHLLLEKDVAVKVLHSTEHHPRMLARFRAEARAASRIDQVNVVRVLDFGEEAEALYLTMELLAGETLFNRLRRIGRYPADQAIELSLQILGALNAAHREGIIHRDLKPGNIMLVRELSDDGETFERLKVCDFGIAKMVGDDPGFELTEKNSILGTPNYMAPEQASGDVVDARTDLYACGAVLYEMLSGRPPFVGDSVTEVLVRVLVDEAPPLSVVVPSIDPRLAAIVARALARKRDDRFANAPEMILALRGLLDVERLSRPWIPRAPSSSSRLPPPTIAAPPPSPPPVAVPPARSKLAWALYGAMALAAVSFEVEPAPLRVLAPAPIPVLDPARVLIEKMETLPIAVVETLVPPPVLVGAPQRPAAHSTRRSRPAVVETRTEPATVSVPAPAAPVEPEVETETPEIEFTIAPASEPSTEPAPTRPERTQQLSALSLEDLRVSGGLAAKRCAVALERSLPALRTCAVDAIIRRELDPPAAIMVGAKIGGDGRLRQIRVVEGGTTLSTCVAAALSSARMPRPDTGDADVLFQLRAM